MNGKELITTKDWVAYAEMLGFTLSEEEVELIKAYIVYEYRMELTLDGKIRRYDDTLGIEGGGDEDIFDFKELVARMIESNEQLYSGAEDEVNSSSDPEICEELSDYLAELDREAKIISSLWERVSPLFK